MWLNIGLQIVASIVIIALLHYFYHYLQNTYFRKHTKANIVNDQAKKYKEIAEEMSKNYRDGNDDRLTVLEKREMYEELSELVLNHCTIKIRN